MKIPFSEYQRRGMVPLAGLGLAIYYLFVLLPLARQAKNLDEPVRKAWQKLSTSLEQTNVTALDFLYITNQLNETRQAWLILELRPPSSLVFLFPAADYRANFIAAQWLATLPGWFAWLGLLDALLSGALFTLGILLGVRLAARFLSAWNKV